MQPVCVPCHQLKTTQESRSLTLDILASQFEQSTWERYVPSERPPPMVYKLKEPDSAATLEIADIVRCRKRSLEFNLFDILVFSVLDAIEEVHDTNLGDICFVAKPQRKTSACLELCYTPGWSHRSAVEFWLHHGVITWGDITHRITATAHYRPDSLARPQPTMEQAWQAER